MKSSRSPKRRTYTRRQFIGNCAAGASLISISPFMTLIGCEPGPRNRCHPSERCSGPEISSTYSNESIRIKINFPDPYIYDKWLNIESSGQKQFSLVKICNTGSVNHSGLPEIPYMGLLVHIPECMKFDLPVEESGDVKPQSYANPMVYPAQVCQQDNVRYLKNYNLFAEFNSVVYSKFLSYPTTVPSGDFVGGGNIIFPIRDRVYSWSGPYYLGSSRFFILNLYPFFFTEFDAQCGAWLFKKSITVEIKNIRPDPDLPPYHFLDTPYLPQEFDRIPRHERIIDPWYDPDNCQQILPDIASYNPGEYQQIGPEMIIFYNATRKKQEKPAAKMQESALDERFLEVANRLKEHKIRMGYTDIMVEPLSSPTDIASDAQINTRISEIINRYTSGQEKNKHKLWRLNSILLLGDILNIQDPDLYSCLNQETGEAGQTLSAQCSDQEVNRNYYSDYNLTIPINQTDIAIRSRLPNIIVGRIPAKTGEEADLIVKNIIEYETGTNQIHRNLTFASYFQDSGKGSKKLDGEASRDFMQTIEEIRLRLDTNFAEVERIYQTENMALPVKDHRYRDGTCLDPSNHFLDANTARSRIIEAFRKGGRFIVHRDHGWMNGWAHPNFKIPDTWQVKYENKVKHKKSLPSIVFNMDCLTGRFTGENFSDCINEPMPGSNGWVEKCYKMPKDDNDCFSEALLKGPVLPDGSRLNLTCPAVIASTEVSPTFENDWLLKIMFDLIYGGILSGEPKPTDALGQQRLGTILNTAKILLHAYIGDRGMHLHENIAFHVLGDPTLKV
jgi:hypothetical protein